MSLDKLVIQAHRPLVYEYISETQNAIHVHKTFISSIKSAKPIRSPESLNRSMSQGKQVIVDKSKVVLAYIDYPANEPESIAQVCLEMLQKLDSEQKAKALEYLQANLKDK